MKKIIYAFLILTIAACNGKREIHLLDASNFKMTIDDKETALYTLKSKGGITMQVTNFGGRVVALWVPDKKGNYDDVVLGHPSIQEYVNPQGERFLGPVVGRYANRIANGKFEIDGESYQLPINNNGQTLHGGLHGLDMVVWDVDEVTEDKIVLSYISPDGDEGFPGEMKIQMTYTLTSENEFKLSYLATTNKSTVINLSHHGVFNLKGEGNGTITDNLLTINGDFITPVNDVLIPTGEFLSVENTPFDFRKAKVVGQDINSNDIQLLNGSGYDHNWVIKDWDASKNNFMARMEEPMSGRVMEVYSNQPGLQFYSGNFFDGKVKGKSGKSMKYREAFALETQFFPDSPNHDNFPSTRLNPGEHYEHYCTYKFSVVKK